MDRSRKTLLFRRVTGDFVPLGILFATLHPIFVKKKLKISSIFTRWKSKTPLCFKEHGVRLLFLPTLTIEPMAFDRFVLFFSNKFW